MPFLIPASPDLPAQALRRRGEKNTRDSTIFSDVMTYVETLPTPLKKGQV